MCTNTVSWVRLWPWIRKVKQVFLRRPPFWECAICAEFPPHLSKGWLCPLVSTGDTQHCPQVGRQPSPAWWSRGPGSHQAELPDMKAQSRPHEPALSEDRELCSLRKSMYPESVWWGKGLGLENQKILHRPADCPVFLVASGVERSEAQACTVAL